MFKSAINKANEKGMASESMNQVEITKNLKNGYLALAATFGMTVLGYVIGMMFLPQIAGAITGVGGILLFMVAMIGMIFAISAFQDSYIGFILLLAFGVIEGIFLTPLIAMSSSNAIISALCGTVIAAVATSAIAFSGKVDSAGWGKFLLPLLIAMLVGVVVNLFLQSTGFQIMLSLGIIALMSAFMVYDTQQALKYPKKSYVAVALGFYLNIINIFINLLSLFGLSDD